MQPARRIVYAEVELYYVAGAYEHHKAAKGRERAAKHQQQKRDQLNITETADEQRPEHAKLRKQEKSSSSKHFDAGAIHKITDKYAVGLPQVGNGNKCWRAAALQFLRPMRQFLPTSVRQLMLDTPALSG